MSNDQMISVLIVVQGAVPEVAWTFDRLKQSLETQFRHHEVIIIDNGIIDDDQQEILSLLDRYSNLRYIRLTRPHAYEAALCCAMEASVGDVVVTFDLRYDSIDALPVLVARASEGMIAIGRRVRHEGWARALMARVFYRIANALLGAQLRIDEGNQRAYPRQILNAIGRIKNRRRNLRFFSSSIGFRRILVDIPVGAELPREPIFAVAMRNLDLLFSNSMIPLRFASFLGLFGAALNGLYILYVLLVAVFKDRTAEGWVTQSLSTTGMFFLVFLILSMMVEYLGRVFEEVQERPLYFVDVERDSPASAGRDVLNVV
jgi:glycosyltransferase involved in cell wall biosynthesis